MTNSPDTTESRERRWIVRLESGIWLAPWDGDPGRTLLRSMAVEFHTEAAARRALSDARKYRPFKAAALEAQKP